MFNAQKYFFMVDRETQVIISLKEYNELLKLKHDFNVAYRNGKTILFHESYFPGHAGYKVNTFLIINPTDLIKDLHAKLNEQQNEIKELKTENNKLLISKKRRWWQ